MGNQIQYKKPITDSNNMSSKINQEISSKQNSSNNIPLCNDFQQLNLYSISTKLSDLKLAFKKFAIDGDYLNYEKFNECIGYLLKFDIPLIRYTFLAERLFKIMDKYSNEKIQENDFVESMKIVLSSREAKIKLSFDAISTLRSKQYIDFDELVQYFVSSWQYGFKILYNILNINHVKDDLSKNNIPIPAKNQMDYLIEKNREEIKKYIVNSFLLVGVKDLSNISYESYKLWITYDHTLEIVYFNKRVRIAMDLMCLDNIELNLNA